MWIIMRWLLIILIQSQRINKFYLYARFSLKKSIVRFHESSAAALS
ncbi:hypothetical protein SAMN04488084_101589 [Pedobacter antarcticus]|nr:hypothetical protein SAMN04488084_101589 [Pedobacter antarcticus]